MFTYSHANTPLGQSEHATMFVILQKYNNYAKPFPVENILHDKQEHSVSKIALSKP